MQTIKAIETFYDGHRFRSRLEARWAVFFKTLGTPYEYEKEGFDLGNGLYYLPDFWLPELQCWFEVKGEPDLSEKDLQKVYRFVADGHQRLAVFFGSIEPGMQGMVLEPTKGDPDYANPLNAKWRECPACRQLSIGGIYRFCHCFLGIDEEMDKVMTRLLKRYGETWWDNQEANDYHDWWYAKIVSLMDTSDSPRLKKAYTAARQARFEFGEKGAK